MVSFSSGRGGVGRARGGKSYCETPFSLAIYCLSSDVPVKRFLLEIKIQFSSFVSAEMFVFLSFGVSLLFSPLFSFAPQTLLMTCKINKANKIMLNDFE